MKHQNEKTPPLFLNDEEMAILTGFKWHSKQVEWLRKNGVPFRVNAGGQPVVTRSAIEGGQQLQEPIKKAWEPSVISSPVADMFASRRKAERK